MALSTEIEAKSPDTMAPGEMKLPSMEPVPAASGTPGLLGLLSRPVFTIKLGVTTLLLGAVAVLLTPAAFPPRAWRPPSPLPSRAPARRPRHRVSAPLPAWMAKLSAVGHRPSVAGTAKTASSARAASGSKAIPKSRKPTTDSRRPAALSGPIRIHEPTGALCVIAPNGVTVAGQRVPPEWAREARKLFAAPAEEELAASPAQPALRLLAPDPGDAAVLDPPDHLRWAPVPGVRRYMLTLEALSDPAEQIWSPVQDLFLVEVTGTEFPVPAKVRWAPGALYRWRVQTGDGETTAAGRFRILTASQRLRLLAARRALGKSRLLRAAIYRSYGLHDAALTELQTLPPKQPALQRAIINVEADIRHQRAVAAE